VKPPFEMTRILPELYRIILIGIEEMTQLAKNGCGMELEWM